MNSGLIKQPFATKDFVWMFHPAPGTVHYYVNDQAPPGWLSCNGSEVSRTVYAALFDAIDTRYGEGDGETTFLLPDLRGVFIRGHDQGAGRDEGREMGRQQGDAIRNIHGTLENIATHGAMSSGVLRVSHIGNDAIKGAGLGWHAYGINFDASRVVPTASEFRPINMAVTAIIKY